MDTPMLDGHLRELLRRERHRLVEGDMSPFDVCHDRALDEMATYKPKTIEELMKIKGIKKIKASQYGKAFLAVISQRPDLCARQIYTEDQLKGLHNSAGFLWNFGKDADSKSRALAKMEVCLERKIYSLGPDHPSTRWTRDAITEWKGGPPTPNIVQNGFDPINKQHLRRPHTITTNQPSTTHTTQPSTTTTNPHQNDP